MNLADEEMGLAERQPLLPKKTAKDEVLDVGGIDIVQFNSAIYYADEREITMKVDIIRVGTMKGRAAVKYSTKDASAKGFEQYEPASGRVVFEEGENTKTIEIPVLDDGIWTATKEFKVCLTDQQNCTLGLYLHQCRVKILNAEKFPSDQFVDDLEKGEDGLKAINDWDLFFEYFQLNYYSSDLQWQTVLVIVLDQMVAVMLFITLWVGVYLVDTVFAKGVSSSQRLLLEDRTQTAALVAAWFVLPHVVTCAWEALKVHIDIVGVSREYLQMSMMRQSLDYTSESRNKMSSGDLNVAITIGAEAVAKGYVAALNLCGTFGRILAIVVFICIFQRDRLAIGSAVFTVLALVVFICFRVESARSTQEAVEKRLMLVDTLVEESSNKHRLFSDYNKRGVMADMFANAAGRFSKARIPDTLVHLTGQYVTRFLCGVVIFNYIVRKTSLVLDGHCSLGIFLATISIFSTYLVDNMINLNDQMMLIVDAFVPLKEFTNFLNFKLELEALKKANRDRRRRTTVYSDQVHLTPRAGRSNDYDSIPIMTKDMSFQHSKGHTVLQGVNIELGQGDIAAVVGSAGSGKATLVQLLANVLTPTTGTVFVPSHLRTLHVSHDPMLMHTSMLQNLALGLPDPGKISEEGRQRIISILEMLNLTEVIEIINTEAGKADVFDEDAEPDAEAEIKFRTNADGNWENTISHSVKVKVHLARALIANPEVMVIDRTLQGLDDEEAKKLLAIIFKHVEEKGLCLPEKGRAARRPRTVVFSTEDPAHAALADTILEVHAKDHSVSQKRLRSSSQKAKVSTKGSVGCFPR